VADHPNGTARPEAMPDAIPGVAIPNVGSPAQRSESALPPTSGPAPRRWSLTSLLVLAVAAVLLVGVTCWHIGTVFLSIAPSNTVSQAYRSQIDAHVYPEFEQNWELFAPNPLQDNIDVQVRLQTLAPDGSRPQSGWIDLTAQDIARIRDNPFPSHVNQNLLRRAWDFYTSLHNPQNDAASPGPDTPLSKEYLKRIGLQRTGRDWHGNQIIQIEFRAGSTPVGGPAWTGAPQKPQTSYQTLPWWAVSDDDYTGLHG